MDQIKPPEEPRAPKASLRLAREKAPQAPLKKYGSIAEGQLLVLKSPKLRCEQENDTGDRNDLISEGDSREGTAQATRRYKPRPPRGH